jgi:phosphate transport system substrate-binding protein
MRGKLLAGLVILFISGCGSNKQGPEREDKSYNNEVMHISCDESFKPVIDAQIAVYESLHPGTKIIAHYKPEADCLKDLVIDSIRMIIMTRKLSKAEANLVSDSTATGVNQLVMAKDVISIVLNPAATDTFFSIKEIRDLLSGKSNKNLIPVFDGLKATSTVRFMLDSVLRGDSLTSKAVAAENSVGVIDYVSKVPNAVGFVGFSWIGNSDDTAQLGYRRKVKLAYVESTDSADAYIQPSQFFIYTNSYPMVRDLVYVLKERGRGLGHSFAYFLEQNDKGQLIFRRSYLFPVIRPNYIRDAELHDDINNQ